MSIKLKYFDISGWNGFCGRGGVVRFYLLLHNMKYEDEYVTLDDWEKHVKADVVKSGESPTGHIPIVFVDGQPLIESFAVLRKLSKQAGEYGKNDDHDYLVDMVADAMAEFRAAVASSAFGSQADKDTYLKDKRKHFYGVLNVLINKCKGSGPHVVSNQASFADCIAFACLWDDMATYGKDTSLLEAHPQLAQFFEAFLGQAPVAGWCKGARADLVAQAPSAV